METAAIVFLAMVLDAVFGEPKWLWNRVPHPAVLMGKAIGWADKKLNTENARPKGVLLVVAMVVAGWWIGGLIEWFGAIPTILVGAILIAQKSLVEHVQAVGQALRRSLSEGRVEVARIVGRDTKDMTEPEVARAGIESAAENLSDGVVAPVFWFLVLGLPGLLIYKMVNTADSMIGYRTEKYEDFGWASARFDDLINWIPARITAAFIMFSGGKFSFSQTLRDDASLHRSPNAGWPEAAMARVLGIALSGPRSYEGEMQKFPYVNEFGRRTIGGNEVDQAASTLWRSWAILLGCIAMISLI
ncbi:adenosylcobinamide-phosphate synthase CbiB [Cognatishimia activa]|uniref:Cobalamin biosynthesis protein CobD n=1 Tax=Cognatishimia activa TaxID=1715691 RepID=A0A0P1J077_9RHOB|nr:adenosylcobinamide-phosphate synthase CbiB [Cognatishimia activa]CUI52522.1 cobalamin biosynthesis protein [Cognatishimia activa]CUK27294.1 cobalamin biosynthesis protein [Cognatishimia activa]